MCINKYLNDLLSDINNNYKFIINEQQDSIQVLEKELQRKQIVKVTFYHPKSRGINSDSDPNNTAIMRKPVVGRTVAISDDLFNIGWLGSKVYLEQFGVFIMEDRTNHSIKGMQIDICVESKEKAFELGVKYNIVAIRLI